MTTPVRRARTRCRSPRGVSALLLGLACATAGARGSATPDERPARAEFGEEITVIEVQVPVRVVRQGEPVRGLTRENFELFEGGERREIKGFEMIDLGRAESGEESAAEGPSEAVAAPRAQRNLLLLFDYVSSSRADIRRAVLDSRKLVDASLGPHDVVAIAISGGSGGSRIVVPFTAERDRLRAGLDFVAALTVGDRRDLEAARRKLAKTEPSGRTLATIAEELGPTAALASSATDGFLSASDLQSLAPFEAGGRLGDDEPELDPVQASLAPGDAAEMAAELAQSAIAATVEAQFEGLERLLTLLRDLPGQKHLILFSRGFSAGMIAIADSLERPALLRALDDLASVCRATGWVLQPIDLAGIPEFDQPGFAAEPLFALAEATGGKLRENFNRFDEAAARILRETEVTYVLSYERAAPPRDGSRHELDVRLVNAPAGARVHHGAKYDAPVALAKRSALERRLDRAAWILGEREIADLDARATAFAWPAENGLWRVATFVEVDGASIERAAGPDRDVSLEIAGYAVDADRRVPSFFSRGAKLDLARIDPAARERGLRLRDELELPAGSYRLRLMVHESASERFALGTTPLVIGGPTLWPALVAGIPTGWLAAATPSREDGEREVDPLRFGPERAEPAQPLAGVRLVPPFEAQLLFVLAGAEPGKIALRLVDGDGAEVAGAPLGGPWRLDSRRRVTRWRASLATGALAPGAYRLVVTAEDRQGSRWTRAEDFVVLDARP